MSRYTEDDCPITQHRFTGEEIITFAAKTFILSTLIQTCPKDYGDLMMDLEAKYYASPLIKKTFEIVRHRVDQQEMRQLYGLLNESRPGQDDGGIELYIRLLKMIVNVQ